MAELTTIELFKEDMKFSAAHYTIFSADKRETLHGHNFTVYAAITADLNDLGMPFDYDVYKEKLRELCGTLNQYTLIAGNSNYQTIVTEGDYTYVQFADEKIPFLTKDIIILPLRNITVEELASWFIHQLASDKTAIQDYRIQRIVVKVFSGPGQCGAIEWTPA